MNRCMPGLTAKMKALCNSESAANLKEICVCIVISGNVFHILHSLMCLNE